TAHSADALVRKIRDKLAQSAAIEGLPGVRKDHNFAGGTAQRAIQRGGFAHVLRGMNHLDALSCPFPYDELGTVRRAIERNDDLKLAARIVEFEAVLQPSFDGGCFIVSRDHN